MLSDKEKLAVSLFESNDLHKAKELYTEICENYVENAKSWHMLSAINGMLGMYSEAASCAREVIKLRPDFSGAYNNLGNALLMLGSIEEAKQNFERALQLDPNNAESYTNLGDAWCMSGDYQKAIEFYRESLAKRSEHAETYNNLGNALLELCRTKEALSCFERALNLKPRYIAAQFNIGRVYQEMGRFDSALACYESVVKLQSSHVDSWLGIAEVMYKQARLEDACKVYMQILKNFPSNIKASIGVVSALIKQGRVEEAARICKSALKAHPGDTDLLYCLGLIHKESGDIERSVSCLRSILEIDPDHAQAMHSLAVMGGIDQPAKADDRYVTNLFDGYAGTFDKHLVEVLDYRTPEYLKLAIERAIPRHSRINILDLGCGTGLCGMQLVEFARLLVGVDLSAKMLQKARERGIYDELILGNLMVPFERGEEVYDLVVAADVFVYVGDLDGIFRAVADALTLNGMFAFSIEVINKDQPYILHEGGRYAHALDYVLSIARLYQFETVSVDNVVLRKNQGKDVDGYIIVLRNKI